MLSMHPSIIFQLLITDRKRVICRFDINRCS